jgi:hypothetical protein
VAVAISLACVRAARRGAAPLRARQAEPILVLTRREGASFVLGSSTVIGTFFQTDSDSAIFEMITQDRYPLPEPTQIQGNSVYIS